MKMRRNLGRLTLFVLFISCSLVFTSCSLFQDERPNILIILTDDQRYDTMQYMPETVRLLFNEGAVFPNAYVTTPLCCPSRSSILTGMYAHNHGVRENSDELHEKTVFEYLNEDGYYTGLVGKYLNTWKGDPRPEFDYWVSYKFGETRYFSPRLNVNGEWKRHADQYVTYVLGDYAIDFLDRAAKQRKPFAFLLAVSAPHNPVEPAPEDAHLPIELPARLPSFNEEDVSDKPAWLSVKESILDEAAIAELDMYRRGQILTLISLDRTLAKVINKLEETGEMDNTMIIFLSDNGMHWGEHRLASKNTFYEESVRVPFAVRYPPLIPKPYVDEKVVANIDIAPTMLNLAGIPVPSDMDGLSLLDLFAGKAWREGVLIEGWPPRADYYAIHTERYVYAVTPWDDYMPAPEAPQYELYDLEVDPYQMENIASDPANAELIEYLRELLEIERSK